MCTNDDRLDVSLSSHIVREDDSMVSVCLFVSELICVILAFSSRSSYLHLYSTYTNIEGGKIRNYLSDFKISFTDRKLHYSGVLYGLYYFDKAEFLLRNRSLVVV